MSTSWLILGCGDSGLAAARLLAFEGRRGWTASETAPLAGRRKALEDVGFPWRKDVPEEVAGGVVVSPGFAIDHPWVVQLRQRGVDPVPEFELGAARLRGRQVAVTGSLGKTSMVMLAERLLSEAGRVVRISGNIGIPVCEVALEAPQADVHVLELSSFQLEAARAYRPDVGICLNVVPNHLDRHGSMERYAGAKARLFQFQTPEDAAVIPDAFPVAVPTAARRIDAHEVAVPRLEGTPFAAGPLRENLRCLLAGLENVGLPGEDGIERVVRAFRFPPHRMTRLEVPGAGIVIDDSKSTCLSATRAALESLPGTVHLIVGGLDKGEDFTALNELFRHREVRLYLTGASAEAMRHAWRDVATVCEIHADLGGCVKAAWARRDCVEPLLFSPGCASFDQYPDYKARGTHFQRLVAERAADEPLTEPPRRKRHEQSESS